ncbi:hypothetical protein [Legionella maioricensis]|uniref:Coiled-coil protein n=1 Tax=Legionella maioricensis TaxID=2896528 RepID=A0A9X2D223_9GAMM|nr:hypothetical protein [Legionella maioricensis]MCL9684988.1 hypothetical protein [Legionella maioricensis]MCL9688115.1 hypothetical protein [Legionella maioricensis]
MRKSKINLIKQGFFNRSIKEKNDFSFVEEDFDLNLIQFEFSSLWQLFIANKQLWLKNRAVVSYMYYLCNLMILYYQYDYVRADLEKLKQKRQAIELFISENFPMEEQELINKFSNELKTSIRNDTPAVLSISKIRGHISILNANRSHWGYSRALANHAIIYLQKNCRSSLTNEAYEVIGSQCVSTEIIELLNKSREPLVVMGIILYELRFFINLVLIMKHLVQAAINKELSAKKVLKQEIEKRGFTMISDMTWGIVNLLTTYNNFFHISALAVPPIIVSFLAFDAVIFIAQWATDTAKYNKQLQELVAQKNEATAFEQVIINRQIDLLNDEWEAQNAYYLINFFAASILVISFGFSMVCSGPLVLAGLAFFSMMGNALYNASEEYKKYQQSRIAIRRELSNGIILNDDHHHKLMAKLNEESGQTSTDFWKALIYNIGGTAFIITAAVISWPIALSITLTYMAYRLNNAYQKKSNAPGTEQEVSPNIYRLFYFVQSESPILSAADKHQTLSSRNDLNEW